MGTRRYEGDAPHHAADRAAHGLRRHTGDFRPGCFIPAFVSFADGFGASTKPSCDGGETIFIADENVAKQTRGSMNRH